MVVSARGIRTLSREERTDYAFLESYYLAPQGRTGAGAELPGDMRLRRITRPARIDSRSTGLRKKLAFLQRRTLHGERYRLLQLLREFETHPARFGGHTPLALTPDLIGKNNEVMDVIHIDSGSNYSNGSINTNKVVVILNEKEFEDDKVFTTAPVNTNTGVTIKSDDKDNSTKLIANTESVVQIKSEDEDGRTRLRNTNERTASTNAGDGSEKSSTDSYDKVITTKIENKDDNDKNERGSISISNHDIAATSKRNVTAIKTENEDEDDYTTNKRYKTSTDNTNEVTAFKYENEDNSNTEGGNPIATNNYKMVAIKKEDEDEDENGNTKNEGYNIFINNTEDENVVIKMENEDDINTEGSSNESINNYKNITAIKNENSYSIQDGGIRHTISSSSPSSSVASRNSSLNNQVMCDDDDADNTSNSKDVKINNNNNDYHKEERTSNPTIDTVMELQKVVSMTATTTSIEEIKMCFKCGTEQKVCYYYNNTQWKEATGSGLCKDCRDNLKVEQMPKIAVEQTSIGKVKICFKCGTEKEKRYFSKTQWKKATGCGSCIDCNFSKEQQELQKKEQQTKKHQLKSCFECKMEKERQHFYKTQWKKATGDGGFCKDCHIIFLKEQQILKEYARKNDIKDCSKCGEGKKKNFYSKSQWQWVSGYGVCRICVDTSQNEQNRKAATAVMTTCNGIVVDGITNKVCIECGEAKNVTFYKSKQWKMSSGLGCCDDCWLINERLINWTKQLLYRRAKKRILNGEANMKELISPEERVLQLEKFRQERKEELLEQRQLWEKYYAEDKRYYFLSPGVAYDFSSLKFRDKNLRNEDLIGEYDLVFHTSLRCGGGKEEYDIHRTATGSMTLVADQWTGKPALYGSFGINDSRYKDSDWNWTWDQDSGSYRFDHDEWLGADFVEDVITNNLTSNSMLVPSDEGRDSIKFLIERHRGTWCKTPKITCWKWFEGFEKDLNDIEDDDYTDIIIRATLTVVKDTSAVGLAIDDFPYSTFHPKFKGVQPKNLKDANNMLAKYEDGSNSWVCKHLGFHPSIAFHVRQFIAPPPVFFFEKGDVFLDIEDNMACERRKSYVFRKKIIVD